MGKHARPSRSRTTTKIAIVTTVPALASIALTSPAYASVVHKTTISQISADDLITVKNMANLARLEDQTQKTYTVHGGDSLSSIAQSQCGTSADWTGLYKANEKVIGTDPNLIVAGENLTLDCSQAQLPQLAQPVQLAADVVQSSTPVVSSAPVTGTTSFQQCVIARESGGDPNIWNATGHYGLYQFSESTWVAYGGSAADFGHASAAEQTQVFDNAMATPGGASNWAPYDGC